MARITIHDRLVAALQHRGEAIIADACSTRYTVLTRTRRETGEQVGFYFVGRAGALRAGRTVGESRPVGADFRAKLLGTTTR
jgi:hypothetical protein